jgi:Ca2+/Na+ antiporter
MWERDKKILIVEIFICILTIVSIAIKVFLHNSKISIVFLFIEIVLLLFLVVIYFIAKKKNTKK